MIDHLPLDIRLLMCQYLLVEDLWMLTTIWEDTKKYTIARTIQQLETTLPFPPPCIFSECIRDLHDVHSFYCARHNCYECVRPDLPWYFC